MARQVLTGRQPPVGTPLIGGHPLALAMSGAYVFNQSGSNGFTRNWAKGIGHLSQSVAGITGGRQGFGGQAIGTDGTGVLSGTNPLQATSNVSVACRFRVAAAPSGQQGVWSIGSVKDDGSPLIVLDTNAGGTLLQTLVGDDAFVTVVNPLVVGTWYTHVTTWGASGGTQADYIGFGSNAMQVSSRTYTLNAVNSTNVFIGSGFANPLSCDFEFLYLWNRVLKYDEALSIIRDPYQVWDHGRKVTVKSPVVAPGVWPYQSDFFQYAVPGGSSTTFIPGWAYGATSGVIGSGVF